MTNFVETIRKNWELIHEKDQKAKQEGKLVGRYVAESVADGKAIYEIVRENKNTVRIRVCKGIGDDYRVSYWGDETTIDKAYALQNIGVRDKWAEMVAKRSS